MNNMLSMTLPPITVYALHSVAVHQLCRLLAINLDDRICGHLCTWSSFTWMTLLGRLMSWTRLAWITWSWLFLAWTSFVLDKTTWTRQAWTIVVSDKAGLDDCGLGRAWPGRARVDEFQLDDMSETRVGLATAKSQAKLGEPFCSRKFKS